MTAPLVTIEGLGFRGGSAALDDLTTTINPAGDRLVGPDGAGKTSWCALMAALLTPSDGRPKSVAL
jgi:ABC-type branched-subunit amino acid transport system ATPase component